MGFPASPADYRCAPGPEIRRPPDYRKSGRSPRVHDAVRAAIWRTGKLKFWEPARPGVGHVDAGPTLPGVRARGALAGRARGAGMGATMARRRASPAARGKCVRNERAGCLCAIRLGYGNVIEVP